MVSATSLVLQTEYHDVGTAASVRQVKAYSHPQPHFSITVIGLCRFRVVKVTREAPFPIAQVTQLDYFRSKGL